MWQKEWDHLTLKVVPEILEHRSVRQGMRSILSTKHLREVHAADMDVCNAPEQESQKSAAPAPEGAPAADAPAAEMKADVEQAENGVVSQLEEGVETVVVPIEAAAPAPAPAAAD